MRPQQLSACGTTMFGASVGRDEPAANHDVMMAGADNLPIELCEGPEAARLRTARQPRDAA